MFDKKSILILLLIGHAVCAGTVCAAVCIAKSRPCGISEKAKQAFKVLEKTLSV